MSSELDKKAWIVIAKLLVELLIALFAVTHW